METNEYIKELNELRGYEIDELREVREVINIIEKVESMYTCEDLSDKYLIYCKCERKTSSMAAGYLFDNDLIKAKRYAAAYHYFNEKLNELINNGIPF